MRLILSGFFLLVINVTVAQETITLSGKINDKETGEPIPYAHIFIKETSIGSTSNQLGEFIFKISGDIPSSFLVVSSLGYKNKYIQIGQYIEKHIIILMEPEATELNEVVVSPIDPVVIIDSVLARIPSNYHSDAYTAYGFQREYVKASAHYIQLLEVAFRTYGSNVQQQSEVLKASFVEDKEEKEPLWNPSRGGFYTFGWTQISGIEYPTQQKFLGVELDERNDLHKYYDFEYKGETRFNDEDVYVIGFDQKRKIKKPLLKGILYISQTSYAVAKLTYEISANGINKLKSHSTWGGETVSKPPKKIDVKADRGVITYKKAGNKWFLNSMILDTEFDASFILFGVTISKKENLIFHSERVVTGIDTISQPVDLSPNIAEIGSIPTLQNFIKKEYESYEINEKGWSEFNLIKSDTSFVQVAQELKRKNERWSSVARKQALERIISQTYSKNELREDIEYLEESLEALHPGYTWYTNLEHLRIQFQSLKENLENKLTEIDLLNQLAPIIANINCGHTEILPSGSRSKYQELYKKEFPLKIKFLGSQAFVTVNYESITSGKELVSINGIPISTIVERLKSFVSSDGYNETYKHFRLQNEFSRLYSLYYPVSDTFTIGIINQQKQVIEHKLLGRDLDSKSSIATSKSFEMIDSLNAGYLKISSFNQDQTFRGFLDSTFNYLKVNQAKYLIIDLRGNQGGIDYYGALLYSYLTNEPFRFYDKITVSTDDSVMLNRLHFGETPFSKALPDFVSSLKAIEGGRLEYINHQNLNVQRPSSNSFQSKVYLLVNGGTFSTASEFASIVFSNDRAVIVGEETGGGYYGNCSLGTPMLTLPNSKLRIFIPLGKYELAVNKEATFGHGVAPEYILNNTTDTFIRDKALELCTELILNVQK